MPRRKRRAIVAIQPGEQTAQSPTPKQLPNMVSHDIVQDGDVTLVFRSPQPAFDLKAVNVDEYLLRVPDQSSECPCGCVDHESGLDNEPGLLSETESLDLQVENELVEPEAESSNHEIRVSSMHLMVASPYFRRALKSDWKESTLLRTQNHVRLDQKDGDLEAMLILMNMIHGRVRSVPKTISLEILARIAILVDYYECHEVVEHFSDMWIADLKNSMPKRFSRDAVLWICISSVFRQPASFQESTSLALNYSKGPVTTLGLPLMSKVMGKTSQTQ